MTKSHQLAYLLLTLMAFFLASNHIIGRFVHNEIPPIGLSFWRWLFAAILLLPYIIYKKRSVLHIFKNNIRSLSLLGGLIIAATSLILVALNSTTAINISIINTFQPILTVILSWQFLNQKMSINQMMGVSLSSIGVLVMISNGQIATILALKFNNGDLIAILAMCCFAFYAINVPQIPKELDGAESLFGLIICGCIMLLPFYLIETIFYRSVPISMTTLWAIPALALLVSLFSMLIWNFANHTVGPARATVFINLIPVFGIILATTLLGEILFLSHIIGAVFIFIGVACVIKNRLQND
ncbi:MAG: DMT family transporter [Proteobacteria bacterium]|nr:DMT family transporter [Pseudomonadota bacterium]NOG59595.1 DMT family transporter [Pseudomonadota bacterium]